MVFIKKIGLIISLFFLFIFKSTYAQSTSNTIDLQHLNDKVFNGQLVKDEITRAYITPFKIIWQSDYQNK